MHQRIKTVKICKTKPTKIINKHNSEKSHESTNKTENLRNVLFYVYEFLTKQRNFVKLFGS